MRTLGAVVLGVCCPLESIVPLPPPVFPSSDPIWPFDQCNEGHSLLAVFFLFFHAILLFYWAPMNERYPNRRMRRSGPVARLDPDDAVNRSFVCTGREIVLVLDRIGVTYCSAEWVRISTRC